MKAQSSVPGRAGTMHPSPRGKHENVRKSMGDKGLEPKNVTTRNDNELRKPANTGGAKSGAIGDAAVTDDGLRLIANVWGRLPPAVRESILLLARAAVASAPA